MPDPFAHIRPGDQISFSTTSWNAMLDAGRAQKMQQEKTGTDPLAITRNPSIIKVINGTGSDLDRLSVIGLDVPILLPSDDTDKFLQQVAFRGVIPTAVHKQKFAILLEPAPQDQVVRAYISGVFPVKVDMQDTGDRHAIAESGVTDNLISCNGGGACQILWPECQGGSTSDTGPQWCIVRMGPSTETSFLVQLVSQVQARSANTVYSTTANVMQRTPPALPPSPPGSPPPPALPPPTSATLGTNPERTTPITCWNLLNMIINASSIAVVDYASGDFWITAVGDCANLTPPPPPPP